MRPGLGRRVGAAGALVLSVLLGMPAAPASADPTFTDLKPAANAILDTASVTISGTANASNTVLGLTVKRVTVALDGRTVLTKNCTTEQCPFAHTASFPLNGPHTATITALEGTLVIEGATTTVDRKFAIAAPAARPVLDTPKVNDARTVDLAWSRNTEGDMLYYAVFRKDPGATKYFQVGGKVNHPTSGTKVTFADTTTSTFGGGDYTYQVVAVRKGATGTAESEKLSEPSAGATATVPVLPTTTTAAPLPGAPAAGPTTTVKPAPPAGVDLSGFIASRPPTRTLPTITVPEPPDTGFKGTLPFGARPPGDDIEEGDAEATSPRDAAGSSILSLEGGRPLVPVAGGLVLLLLAMHTRLLSRRVKADADLPVVVAPKAPAPTYVAPAPLSVIPAPAPVPDPELGPFGLAAEEPRAAGDDGGHSRPDPLTVWAPAFNAGDIEVVDVVSSARRPLARAGSR